MVQRNPTSSYWQLWSFVRNWQWRWSRPYTASTTTSNSSSFHPKIKDTLGLHGIGHIWSFRCGKRSSRCTMWSWCTARFPSTSATESKPDLVTIWYPLCKTSISMLHIPLEWEVNDGIHTRQATCWWKQNNQTIVPGIHHLTRDCFR